MLPPPCSVWSLNKSSLLWQSTFRPQLAASSPNLLLADSVYLNAHSCSWQSWQLRESFYLQGSERLWSWLPVVICPTFIWSIVGLFSPQAPTSFTKFVQGEIQDLSLLVEDKLKVTAKARRANCLLNNRKIIEGPASKSACSHDKHITNVSLFSVTLPGASK